MESTKKYFVSEGSIVREIWGKADTVLLIFAGASAEFALNKAVDWLYFTGKLPADPIGRLFSTVEYAKRIVFETEKNAHKAIDSINVIHRALEKSRGVQIPDWAYRDVLFMLIHYSIAAYELTERKLSESEKADLFDAFYRIGKRMNISGLPSSFTLWKVAREKHLREDLEKSALTDDLYKQYKRQLGFFRFSILLQIQQLLLPAYVSRLLFNRGPIWIRPLLGLYKLCKRVKIDQWMLKLMLPIGFKNQLRNVYPSAAGK